ncbi:MAG: hypothetical protein OXD44_02300, partial [Gammaproteobacteria bacterium]|nr:hypothetical protein [Gammaproteobacteria bacterium]
DRPVQAEIEMPDQEPYPVDEESALDGRYICQAIATGLDGEGWSDAQIAWRHSQRADASENRTGSSAATSAERTCPAADSGAMRDAHA